MISETYWDALTNLEAHIQRVQNGLGNYRGALADLELRFLIEELCLEHEDPRVLFDKCVERFAEIDLSDGCFTRFDVVQAMLDEIRRDENV